MLSVTHTYTLLKAWNPVLLQLKPLFVWKILIKKSSQEKKNKLELQKMENLCSSHLWIS